MKQIIYTGFVSLLLLSAISCKKENNSPQSTLAEKSSTLNEITEMEAAANNASIKIGTQEWMTKDLTTSHYRNGDKIPQVKDKNAWASLTTGAWCWYNNNPAYGKLYNWYAVNDPRGLAPAGWHIPGDAEWTTLSTFLGGGAIAGGKMKETGTAHWIAPNTGATNSSGFTGLPGGNRDGDGKFYDVGFYGRWWSSTEYSTTSAWYRSIYYGTSNLVPEIYGKKDGVSVRCVKD